MEKKKSRMPLPSLDDLFSTQETRDESTLEKVRNINIEEIDDFPNHPFKVVDNEEMTKMCESVMSSGILIPVIVRPKDNGRYEMISGHRRKRASELCGLTTIPCIVRDLSLEEATIIMVDSNMQREKILPSEKAFAYKMKLDAMNHQGQRTDLDTSTQVVSKLRSNEKLGNMTGDSREQIRRYIRLTELIPKLLEMVDNGKIAFNPAVEISYLKKEEQEILLDTIEKYQATPSQHQAIEMKKLSKSGNLTKDTIESFLMEDKPNQTPMLKVSMNRLSSFLPPNLRGNKEREEYVIKAVEWYEKYLKRQREKQLQSR